FLFLRHRPSKGVTASPTVTANSPQPQPAITNGITNDNSNNNHSTHSTDTSNNPISLSWPELVRANAASPSLMKTIMAANQSRGRKQDRRRAKEPGTAASLQQSLLQASVS